MDWFHECYAGESGNCRAFPILGEHGNVPATVVATASLDPIRDQGRAYAAELVQAGSDVTFLEMKGNIHGFLTLRKAIPSGQADLTAILAAVRLMLARAGA
jgi:acetyl esterase